MEKTNDLPATSVNRQASTHDTNKSLVPTPDPSQKKRFRRSSSGSEGNFIPPVPNHFADDQSLPTEFHIPQPTTALIYPSTVGSLPVFHIPEQDIDITIDSPTDRPASVDSDELLRIVDSDIDSDNHDWYGKWLFRYR